mmetsp:Transcript_6757/g.24990  ORF Transcript_6757/g.24990 Transcript_6757/m.24990 type:complete len:474 (+) Transcript_6757:813-2234(+)
MQELQLEEGVAEEGRQRLARHRAQEAEGGLARNRPGRQLQPPRRRRPSSRATSYTSLVPRALAPPPVARGLERQGDLLQSRAVIILSAASGANGAAAARGPAAATAADTDAVGDGAAVAAARVVRQQLLQVHSRALRRRDGHHEEGLPLLGRQKAPEELHPVGEDHHGFRAEEAGAANEGQQRARERPAQRLLLRRLQLRRALLRRVHAAQRHHKRPELEHLPKRVTRSLRYRCDVRMQRLRLHLAFYLRRCVLLGVPWRCGGHEAPHLSLQERGGEHARHKAQRWRRRHPERHARLHAAYAPPPRRWRAAAPARYRQAPLSHALPGVSVVAFFMRMPALGLARRRQLRCQRRQREQVERAQHRAVVPPAAAVRIERAVSDFIGITTAAVVERRRQAERKRAATACPSVADQAVLRLPRRRATLEVGQARRQQRLRLRHHAAARPQRQHLLQRRRRRLAARCGAALGGRCSGE